MLVRDPAKPESFDTEGRPVNNASRMGQTLPRKLLTVVTVGFLWLACLAPGAAGMLLCVDESAESDCCPASLDSLESSVSQTEKVLSQVDCSCCFPIAASAGTPSASPDRVVLDTLAGPTCLRSAVSFAELSVLKARDRGPEGSRLGSLGTVVLLI